MLNDNRPIWDPNYVGQSWTREIRNWELVVLTQYGKHSVGKLYPGITARPNGVLTINGQDIQCSSVEEAKEMGMTTYLLTKEGG